MDTELNMRRQNGGNKKFPVTKLSCTEVPSSKAKSCARGSFGRHTPENVEGFLKTWTFPEKIEEIRERIEQAVADGIPDQKRVMRRNQADGMLDDRFADEIALGFDVEKPFMRWSKSASDTVRVAICMDACVTWKMAAEHMGSRMAVAAGCAAALEALDYEVVVVAARWTSQCDRGYIEPRKANAYKVEANVSVLKDESEPLMTSAFASVSDTDVSRILQAWTCNSNWFTTALSDAEWRELTDCDLYIDLSGSKAVNSMNLPKDRDSVRLKGDDVISLDVSKYDDVDLAIDNLEMFFKQAVGE